MGLYKRMTKMIPTEDLSIIYYDVVILDLELDFFQFFVGVHNFKGGL